MARARPRLQPLPTPTARVRARGDIVEERGLLAIGDSRETPEQARIADLLFLADALEGAGVGVVLVRTDDGAPVLAVRESARVDVLRALVDACAGEPFYAQALKRNRGIASGSPLLVADGELASRSDARLLRFYRPRLDPAGRLLPVDAAAVQLEFWQRSGTEVRVPAPNALTRRRFLRDELEMETIERYGREWRTIRDMFVPHASDVVFPIDIVFSWVDGTDKEWQRARARRMESYIVGEGDEAEARFRQIDELRFALRSVHAHLPWVRRIYIATDSPVPEWLGDHERVRIVRSEEFFEDPGVLPTHNSQAVEAQLHRIADLSEHFLYSNDDMFIGRPLGPEAFFSPGGVTKFVEAKTRIGLGESTQRRSGFENSARVNRALIRERFGRVITRHLEHAATPLRRSVLAEMESTWPDRFRATAASTFRSASDISVTNSLYHYYALLTGRAVQNTQASVRYIDTTTHKGLSRMRGLLKHRAYDFFCLNDGSFPEVGPEERARKVRAFLERYYPVPAPWERTAEDVSAVASAG